MNRRISLTTLTVGFLRRPGDGTRALHAPRQEAVTA